MQLGPLMPWIQLGATSYSILVGVSAMALQIVSSAYSCSCATAERDLQVVWQGVWLVLFAGPVLLLGQ